jgi:hypothetical protein
MKALDLDYVRETIESEGFDYAFVGYSDFKEVKDDEFHRLNQSYLASREALAKYLNVDAS